MLTVEEYWRQHIASIGASVGIEARPGSESMVETFRSPYFGAINARIWFNAEDFLDVYELVRIDANGQAHRVIYSYHLRVEERDVQRWDRDPQKIPELYHHINRPLPKGGQEYEASERVTLKPVVDDCWGIIDQERQGDWPT